MSTRSWRALTYGVPLAFLALFFVYPLATILERGLRADGSLASPLDVLTDPLTRDVVWFTIWQALASTALTFAIGLPGAYVLGRYAFRGRSVVRALVIVPFVLPTVVVALAFLAILPSGLERGWIAILVAHAFFNVAVVVLVVSTFWASLDRRVSEAAATLGAGPWRSFREVTLPRLAPSLAAAAAIVFLFSFTSFGIVLILGGPRLLDDRGGDLQPGGPQLRPARCGHPLPRPAALRRTGRVGHAEIGGEDHTRRGRPSRGGRPAQAELDPREGSRRRKHWVCSRFSSDFRSRCSSSARSQWESGHSLEAYRSLSRPTSVLLAAPWEAVVNSIVYAGAATVIAIVVGGLAAFAVADSRGPRLLDGLLMLPLGASAVMLGFGFVIAFDRAPLDFRAEPWIVPVVQALVAIPFVVRIVAPTIRAIDDRQREAAAVLGASPARVRREIDVPIIGRAVAVAAGFAFAISLGEFGATVFLARPESPTLPVAIFRFLGRPGELSNAQAYALAVVLMAVTAASILLVGRLRVRRSWA